LKKHSVGVDIINIGEQ